jgi:hypothetical protein
MKKKQPYALEPNTPLKLVATHRATGQEFEKKITYSEWLTFKKNINYYYKVYQI